MFWRTSTPPNTATSLHDVILVAGSGRSGTSWFSEVLNADRNYRLLFEPFTVREEDNPDWAATKARYPYVPREATFEHEALMRQTLLGHITTGWVNRVKVNNFQSSKMLVKDIRLNLMLSWIQSHFPELRIIYIVRDPYSVAFSATEHKWGGKVHWYQKRKDMLHDNFTAAQQELILTAKGEFQKNIAYWVIENFIALTTLERNERTTSVYYERLASDPETEYSRLATFCGHSYGKKARKLVHKKSSMAQRQSVIDPSKPEFGHRWDNVITDDDRRYADMLLSATGLDKLYTKRNVPAFDQPLSIDL